MKKWDSIIWCVLSSKYYYVILVVYYIYKMEIVSILYN